MAQKGKKTAKPEGGFRTEKESEANQKLVDIFVNSSLSIEAKLDNFPVYMKRQKITRLLALYEIFKKVLHTKGSIVECGVYRGFGLMSWAHMSAILEPNDLTRRIYGFDSFEGLPKIDKKDEGTLRGSVQQGDLASSSLEELQAVSEIYDTTRFLGHIPKIELIKGDATKTIPDFMKEHPHLMVSLLFLDFDLFESTKIALEHFYERMPKGSILAFDELDNPLWPGETQALLETVGIRNLKIERLDFDPYIGYAIL